MPDPSQSPAGGFVGLDIGATKWMAATDADSLDVLEGRVQDVPELTVDDLARQVLTRFPRIGTVGCAFAGVLDEAGVISVWPNRPSWSGFPIQTALRRLLGSQVVLADDGACAAIGEWSDGAAQGVDDFLCIAFGTGIGSALFLNRRLHPCAPGRPNGLGHFRSGFEGPCHCGAVGCFQAAFSDRQPVPERAITRFAQLVADIALMLNLGAVILTGGRLVHVPELGEAVAGRLRQELLGTQCAVTVSTHPDRSAVIGAHRLAAGFQVGQLA